MDLVGVSLSFSQNACWIKFIGGPFNEQEGFYDHPFYDSICFCDPQERVTHTYVPKGPRGSNTYKYQGEHKWLNI